MELSVAKSLVIKGLDLSISNQTWADLGAGNGLFTRALAGLLGNGSTIYAVDKAAQSLRKVGGFPGSIKLLEKDFVNDELGINCLDGVLMANSLHFVKDTLLFLKHLRSMLRDKGRLILVEYDMVQANQWVPYPMSFSKLMELSPLAGFFHLQKLSEYPSQYQPGNIYSALMIK